MPMRRLVLCVVALLLFPAGVCRAGLYSPADQSEEKLSPVYRLYLDSYLTFKNITNPNPDVKNVLRPKAELILELYPALKADTLTEAQLLDVSSSLIRLHKYYEAIDLLNKEMSRFPDSVLLPANRATAYFLASGGVDQELMGRASDSLQDALDNWPAKFDDLKPGLKKTLDKLHWQKPIIPAATDQKSELPKTAKIPRFEFYRQSEILFQRLLKNRRDEAQKQNPATKRTVDSLFGAKAQPLEFVGPSGSYEPGKLKDSEREKLPDKSVDAAILFVEQLLIWMPLDERLYWQLGELVNASGNPVHALEIFDTLTNKKDITAVKTLPYETFNDHHKILEKFKKDEAGKIPNIAQTNPPPPDNPTTENWEDRWRFFGVGVGSGMVLALFAYWQLRRFFR